MCKKRYGFVTNSSSSSFIISTKETIPKEHIDDVEVLSQENLIESLAKRHYEFEWISIADYIENDELQKICDLTDKQILLLKLASCGEMNTYLELLEKIKNDDTPIYHIFEDRDWLYYHDDLKGFINRAKIIDERGDL